ncbi:RNA polymerase sigma factor sigB-like [Aristolochia californica]|uniref:RNA polymerase sigma factor sigB-like n=1 Tax=Aristolochia californica TaxID=171875 RepID=UPI0035DEC2C7
MACLLPQFNCPPDTLGVCFRAPPHHIPNSKPREVLFLRVQCLSSSTAAVLDSEKLYIPSLEAYSTSVAAVRPLTYVGSIGPPAKINYEAALASETLLTGGEAVIAAAAAEAVALAKAAVEVAKGAVDMATTSNSASTMKLDNSVMDIPLETYSSCFERVRFDNMEQSATMAFLNCTTAESPFPDDSSIPFSNEDSGSSIPTDYELELSRLQRHSEGIAVKSVRLSERKARRERAAEKASTNSISIKSGSSGRKKRSSLQEVDFSDPLRYLRGTTSTSRLLTATEELELSAGIQDLLKLEKLHKELVERYGGQPTFAQWAVAAGLDQKSLRKSLNYGIHCKDKMIKSNIRLVISIAKNYQGAGMNLQDLVQEGCRGLVRGAEKFDASKGFKFSTYAHWWIKQAVRKSLSDQSRTIRLPFYMVEATYRVKEARKQLYSENGRHPDNQEIAEATGLSMKRLTAVLLTPKAPWSLDQKIGINQNLKPSEVIADPDAETTEGLLIKQFMKQDLDKVLDSLNPREKQVIRWRFGLEDGRMKTLQEIGELMGVSRERIRQIESCAFRKLKNKKRTKNLRQYVLS